MSEMEYIEEEKYTNIQRDEHVAHTRRVNFPLNGSLQDYCRLLYHMRSGAHCSERCGAE